MYKTNTLAISVQAGAVKAWGGKHWRKFVFAGCIALILGSLVGSLEAGLNTPLLWVAIGLLGIAANIILIPKTIEKGNKTAVFITLEVIFILAAGLLGTGIAAVWRWLVHNDAINLWIGAGFLPTVGQWGLASLALASLYYWLSGEKGSENIALSIVLGMAIPCCIILAFDNKIRDYALTCAILGLALTIVAYVIITARNVPGALFTKLRESEHLPTLLVTACLGIAGGIVAGAIRTKMSLEDIFWSIGISGLCLNVLFFALIYLFHDNSPQRAKVLFRAGSLCVGSSLGLALLGELLKYDPVSLAFKNQDPLYLLAIGQWGLPAYLLLLTLRDINRGTISRLVGLPTFIVSLMVAFSLLVWSLRVRDLGLYGLEGLAISIVALLSIRLLRKLTAGVRRRIVDRLAYEQSGRSAIPPSPYITPPLPFPSMPIPPPPLPYGPPSMPPPSPVPTEVFAERLPLSADFRFVHEPLGENQSARFVGRQKEIARLVNRILLSDGGTFLITGYRGVGKTSFVKQVIKCARDRLSSQNTRVLDIWLNLARPMEPAELMHHIVRGCYDRLQEEGLLPLLNEDFREELVLAYRRTSYNMARKTSITSTTDVSLSPVPLGGQLLKLSASISRKKGYTEDQQLTFLGYDDKAAEHDIIRLFSNLTDEAILTGGESALDKFLGLDRSTQELRQKFKLIVVFDEMDKLEELTSQASESRRPIVDEMLSALKNVFTTAKIVFIFITGREMQERWMKEVGRGDSLYESVFAYDLYLPCLWTETDNVFSRLTGYQDPLGVSLYENLLREHLRFKGRGIPRIIVRELNAYVQLDNDTMEPWLVLDPERKDKERIWFYAQLQGVLDANQLVTVQDSGLEGVPGLRQDRELLGLYYLVDWILRQGPREFTTVDLIAASAELSTYVSLEQETSVGVIERLLEVLLKHGYVNRLERTPSDLQVGDLAAHGETRYTLTPKVVEWMQDFSAFFEEEAPVMEMEEISRIGRYRIVELVGRGGMGEVYRAIDPQTNQQVALKALLPSLADDRSACERFEREIKVMQELRHPHIVRIRGKGLLEERPFMVMDYVDGCSLRDMINNWEKLDSTVSIQVVSQVAVAFEYIHEQGIVRGDIKPSNIMLNRQGKVYVTDLGIAKYAAYDKELTSEGVLVGTPAYMSPEQILGERTDSRSDIYCLGVLLYEMLTGVPPFRGDSPFMVLQMHVNEAPTPPSQLVSISRELEGIILKCLAKVPEERFQTMGELARSLPKYVWRDLAPLVREVLAKKLEAAEEKRMDSERFVTAVVAQRKEQVPSAIGPARPSVVSLIEHRSGECKVQLIIQEGEEIRTVPLDGREELKIGRQSKINDIFLQGASISRQHASIRLEEASYILYDLAGSSGTYVNGARVYKHYLQNEDVIALGNATLLFLDDREQM